MCCRLHTTRVTHCQFQVVWIFQMHRESDNSVRQEEMQAAFCCQFALATVLREEYMGCSTCCPKTLMMCIGLPATVIHVSLFMC